MKFLLVLTTLLAIESYSNSDAAPPPPPFPPTACPPATNCTDTAYYADDVSWAEVKVFAPPRAVQYSPFNATIDTEKFPSKCQSFISFKKDVTIQSYTPVNPEPYTLELGKRSNLDPNHPTKVVLLVHGFLSSPDVDDFSKLKDSFLEANIEFNWIIINWPAEWNNNNSFCAGESAKALGKYVAQLISSMSTNSEVYLPNMTFIGFSLGAYVAGYAAKELQKSGYGKVPLVIALEPASPANNVNNLDKTIADRVVVIHTSQIGDIQPVGHADIYVNGAGFQPGCGMNTYCSHFRSLELYIESITAKNSFYAFRCTSFENLLCGYCLVIGDIVQIGGDYRDANGILYMETNCEFPFGKGLEGIYGPLKRDKLNISMESVSLKIPQ